MRSAELVRVAQTIACCGEVSGVGRRREIAQSRMRPALVVQHGLRTPTGTVLRNGCIGGIHGASAGFGSGRR
jgi:hypothetical protein